MMKADLVFINGNILTCDDRFSVARSMAIRNGRILAISSDNLNGLAPGPGAIIDLDGRCVLPGMVDGYSHVIYSGLDLLPSGGKLNITALRSIEDILDAVRADAATRKPGEWISTSCMYRGGLKEGRWPDRHDLDKAAPDNPVHLMQGGRPIIANTLALELAGIGGNTPDPTDPAGRIVRDSEGRPTGQLLGGAADLARVRWGRAAGLRPEEFDFVNLGEKEFVAAIEAQQKIFHACGVTATRDVATTRAEVPAYVIARRAGRLKLRTQLFIVIPEKFMRSEAEYAELYDSFFEPWSMGDASLSVGGAAVDYSLDGWKMTDAASWKRHILEANRRGWRLAVTPGVGGEQEVDETLAALEEADRERPIYDRHFPMMHPTGLRRLDQMERAGKLGLNLNPNPMLNYYAAERSVKMFEQVRRTGLIQSTAKTGLEQAINVWGMTPRSWMKQGLHVSAGSNTPAAVYDPEKPLVGLYAFATGDTLAGVLVKEEAPTRRQALEVYTRDGAEALGFLDQYGSLEEGKLADFAVYDTDLLNCPDEDLKNAKVLSTYFQGEEVFRR